MHVRAVTSWKRDRRDEGEDGMRARNPVLLSLAAVVGLVATQELGADDLSGLRLAELHLSAITIVQHLAAFTYGIRPMPASRFQPSTSPPTPGPSCTTPSVSPGGTPSTTFENPDGSCVTITDRGHGSFDKVVDYPDGLRDTVQGTARERICGNDDTCSQRFDIHHTLSSRTKDRASNGKESADYAETLFFYRSSLRVYKRIASGEMVLADRRQAHFDLVQDRPLDQGEYTDIMDIDLPGGEHLQWRVTVDGDGARLDLPARGTYTAQGQSIDFCLVRGGSSYTWTITDARGLDGQFKLQPDFSGQGRALRNGRVEFVGRWNAKAQGTVLLANGQAAVAGPSAGAEAFGRLRFSGFAVANAPTPGIR
jgi:hypothetical protein